MTTIGVISDTHGLLRPEAVEQLRGVDVIVHAGDIGARDVLDTLASLAPVRAVRGNVDTSPWSRALPATDIFEAGGKTLFVLHDLATLDLDPAAAGIHAVIHGHSHRPVSQWREGVLYLNPGSAGPRRFRLPVSLARLHVATGGLEVEPVDLSG